MPAQRFTIAGALVALLVFATMWFYSYDTAQCIVAALAIVAIGWWINASMPPTKQFLSIAAGVIVGAAVLVVMELNGAPRDQSWTAAVTALCSCWWVFESLPLAVTALV